MIKQELVSRKSKLVKCAGVGIDQTRALRNSAQISKLTGINEDSKVY